MIRRAKPPMNNPRSPVSGCTRITGCTLSYSVEVKSLAPLGRRLVEGRVCRRMRGGAQRDEEDLGRLADTEPDDREQQQPQNRHGAGHVDHGVQQILAEPEQTRHHRQENPEGDPDGKALDDPLQRNQPR
jgi:hypothetical protein